MKSLIALTGKAGAGKDTVADFLWMEYGFQKMSFADPLRDAAQAIFGLAPSLFTDRQLKEQVLPEWGMSPRKLLQLLGTEAVKPLFGADIWIKRFMKSYRLIEDTDNVVISDCRFNLEAEAIRARGGIVVHLLRPEQPLIPESGHVSEAGVVFGPGDIVLENDGTIDQLYAKVANLVETLGWHK